MAYNRYHQTSSPWASGAPPMYGSGHAPPPPPQYGAPAYGHSSSPWNTAPPMRQSWGAPNPPPQPHYMSHNQQRAPIRGPMSGPTGKRANMGSWDAPPNKKFAKQGGGRGGGGGGAHWKGGAGGQKFQNQRQFQNNRRNNREVNRAKQTEPQTERRQQHDQAQKAAESLDKKEYSIEQSKADNDANKALEIDSAQEKYVLAVFGYVCQICNVFLKDKGARFTHCQSDDHMTKFNAVEEEAKKESEKKKDEELPSKTTVDESAKEVTNELNETQENGNNKDNTTEEVVSQENESETKTEEAKDVETNQEEENKDNEDTDDGEDEASQAIIEETGGALGGGLASDDLSQTNADAPVVAVDRPVDAIPQTAATDYSGGNYTPNRGRGFPRGRGGMQGRGGGPRGRGRNRGRGRK